MADLSGWLRRVVPYGVRVEIARLRHAPRRLLERAVVARSRVAVEPLPFVLARRRSPLRRALNQDADALPDRALPNVLAAARRIDGLVIAPHQVFSYHASVGRPSRLRGFRRGLELHEEQAASGVGGGACKVTNLVYLVALLGGMKIVERHRHALDLFPDQGRTVPFGCGATVFYNYADLRFENPLPDPVRLRVFAQGEHLVAELRTVRDPEWRADIYEDEHRFYREGNAWIRENRIRRRFVRVDGTLLRDEEVAHNRARVLYEPHLALPAARVLETAVAAPVDDAAPGRRAA